MSSQDSTQFKGERVDGGQPAPTLTTAAGVPVADNQNSLTAGARGPVLMSDYHLMERMAHFNRERVPERVVHAKGGGAYGTFTVTGDISQYTCARLFKQVGNQVPMLARFSTVAGEKGFADTVRDPRGFALKFYTEEGNWDMVGNNTPIFFVRDPVKFQDFIHSQKRHPATGRRSETMQWDFWSLSPESLHQITYMFGDRGIPATWRHMNGYSSHTFSLWNERGERYWVKWHVKTQQGIMNLTEENGNRLAGECPDYHLQDLYETIEQGDYPRWTVYVQIMPEREADTYHIHPFDLTKIWPHKDYPLVEVGVMELNLNPTNYFAEIEQSAFEPSNLPPGFGASPDKMLQARLLSYADAHRYRIGINYAALPVNKAHSPVHTYNRDGQMRFDDNGGDTPVYEPNSFGGPTEAPHLKEPPLRIQGDADRYGWQEDHFEQPGVLFRLMADEEKERLFGNIARHLGQAPQEIQQRQLAHFYRADPAYGRGVAAAIGVDISAIEERYGTAVTQA